MKILITGATGFIGKHLISYLINQFLKNQTELTIIALYRNCKNLKFSSGIGKSIDLTQLQSTYQNHHLINLNFQAIDLYDLWQWDFGCVDALVHLAGLAHQTNLDKNSKLYEQNNYQATKYLFNQAKNHCKHFIFLSTSKVFSINHKQKTYALNSQTKPQDAYGKSKIKAEKIIQKLSHLYNQENKNKIGYTIIRSTLVYGCGVKGNFAKLWQFVQKSPISPSGLINNQRSIIAVDNLVDFIYHCIMDKNAHNQIFLPSDNHPISLKKLIELIAKAQNKKIIQLPIPKNLLKFILKISAKADLIEPLLTDFVLDNNHHKLKWKPIYKTKKAIYKITQ